MYTNDERKITHPFVSCIMPTHNRRLFVPYAINYFLDQDYPNKELLIVDDGSDSIKDIVPENEQIRYLRLNEKMTLGEKRNYCVRQSKYDLIMHWDDDDWMAPNRISYQVKELLKDHTQVCGLQQMYFKDLATGKCWLYKYPADAQPWLAGNSLLYTRNFWQELPFPDMQVASDTQFIFSRKLTSYTVLSDCSFYVAAVHNSNTSFKNTESYLWHVVDPEVVRKITGEDAGTTGKEINAGFVDTKNGSTTAAHLRVTACLLSYKRPGNMQKIVDSLHDYPFIDEIIVWNNNPACDLTLRGQKVKIIQSNKNMICYGRFLCAQQAKNDIVYFQDDDVIIGNVPELYQSFLKNNSVITYALSPRHYQIRDTYEYFSGEIAFLGWGSFIKKEWITVLDKYLEGNEIDYIFCREADKFFTLLFGKRNNLLPGNLKLLDYDSTPGLALYLENDHCLNVALAIRKALEFNRKSLEFIPVTWNIVVTCKDYGGYLEEAINSILLNHADYVITIIDDGSSDDTKEVSQRLSRAYPFISYYQNEKCMGAGYSRNRGIAAVDSTFVVLLDADDKIGPQYLFQAEKLLRGGCDIVNPDAILFGDIDTRWPAPETISLQMQLIKNRIHCCSAFRRSYWAQVGGIDEKMQCWEDYEFWIKLCEGGARVRKVHGDHFYYRKHGPSRGGDKEKELSAHNYIRSRYKYLFENGLSGH